MRLTTTIYECASVPFAVWAIRSDEVHELLFWHFGSDFDPQTFPTLNDVPSEREDRRIVRPTINHLTHFRSSAVRLQLLNSVCRALERRPILPTFSQEDTRRIDSIGRLFRDLRAESTRLRDWNQHSDRSLSTCAMRCLAPMKKIECLICGKPRWPLCAPCGIVFQESRAGV